jgi:hypothetical protein
MVTLTTNSSCVLLFFPLLYRLCTAAVCEAHLEAAARAAREAALTYFDQPVMVEQVQASELPTAFTITGGEWGDVPWMCSSYVTLLQPAAAAAAAAADNSRDGEGGCVCRSSNHIRHHPVSS